MNSCKRRAAVTGRVRVVPFAPAHLADLDPPVFCAAQLRRFAAAYDINSAAVGAAFHVRRGVLPFDLSYQLVGLGGEVYTGGSLHSTRPRFTAYWGPLRIGSAQFQFG